MPILKIDLANIWLALAEPVPFTFANLMTKSLSELMGSTFTGISTKQLPWL